MPWKETHVMDQKIGMIASLLSGEYGVSELSRIYEVSRKTVYKWKKRYDAKGVEGLENGSRAPDRKPWATPLEAVNRILAVRSQHRYWGARKLLAYLKRQQPEQRWPAASTITNILKRHHMVPARRRRRHTPPYTEPFLRCTQPNEVWCVDFKGQFRLGEGKLCYPLTVTDSYSRYLLGCWALEHPTYLAARRCLEEAFRRYGLPAAIRTDNGAPFASVGVGGLSRLGVWLIKLAIQPERIEKAHPEQNGRHERMHRTLKQEAIGPPRQSLAEQQRAFDRFRGTYNDERPHEALGQKTPVSVYRNSTRQYPDRLPDIKYPECFSVRTVKTNGDFKWQGTELYLSSPLARERIGLRQIDERTYQIYFSFYPLALLDQATLRITSL